MTLDHLHGSRRQRVSWLERIHARSAQRARRAEGPTELPY